MPRGYGKKRITGRVSAGKPSVRKLQKTFAKKHRRNIGRKVRKGTL